LRAALQRQEYTEEKHNSTGFYSRLAHFCIEYQFLISLKERINAKLHERTILHIFSRFPAKQLKTTAFI